MAVYVVTGNLGGGKTLVSVGRIRDKLVSGCPVATNIDLNLSCLVGRDNRSARVVRLPDHPTVDDFQLLGRGNTSYDESKNGLIVLDECGTWFNSRSWSDKGRAETVNWFLHARKLGWDIIFIVQHLSVIDKQARLTLAEHLVICRRTDRLSLPFISPVFKFIFGVRLSPPQYHLGIVRYGCDQHAPIVDRWLTSGRDVWGAYDTKQAFSPEYDRGCYSLLPPGYVRRAPSFVPTMVNLMRLTKIHFRRFSRFSLILAGIAISSLFSFLTAPDVSDQTAVVSLPAPGPAGDPSGDPAGDPAGDPSGDPSGDPAGDFQGETVLAWQSVSYLRRYASDGTTMWYILDGGVYSLTDYPFEVRISGDEIYAYKPLVSLQNTFSFSD